MCNARTLLRRDVRDESSARNSVSCLSHRYKVTLRGNVASVYPHLEARKTKRQQEGENRVAARVAWCWGSECVAHSARKGTVNVELQCAEWVE
jgi:hypothetical protein